MNSDFQSIEPMSGSIIFSPQDMLSATSVKRRRGRGRGRGSRRPDALTIKIEEGGDYSRIDVPVACELCGKVVANGKTLVQHMSMHSDVKPFQCPHCPKSFIRMVHLQGHLVLHGIEKQFECPTCHQRFSRQDCVKVHMRLHDKSKCVFCEVCHKAFLTLGALNIHMRIHRGEKPFKCHLCGKCFTQKNHVITHIKRHTRVSSAPFSKKLGPRMFQCEHCSRSFIRLSDYERHVQWNHGAVSDTSHADKIPSYNSVIGEDKSTEVLTLVSKFPSSGETTLNNKVRKKPIRKVMCTIGTQTDQEGGHVIIPRQYQNVASMTTASTQVSAPPTPRPTDDELYENDIFDEGMDRNFSSDEDEIEEQIESMAQSTSFKESETSMVFMRDGTASTSATDDAFDAIIGKAKPEPKQSGGESETPKEEKSGEGDTVIQSELAAEYAKRDEAFLDPQSPPKEPSPPPPHPEASGGQDEEADAAIEEEEDEEKTNKELDADPKQSIAPSSHLTRVQEHHHQQQFIESSPAQKLHYNPHASRPTAKIYDTFNTKNWRGRMPRGRGRGRGRGKNKSFMGLTGATHLRLIRKSMINFISEKTEQMLKDSPLLANAEEELAAEANPQAGDETRFADAEPTSLDKRMKRQTKVRQHGKDFVCNVKTCETCNPGKGSGEEAHVVSPEPPSQEPIRPAPAEPQPSATALSPPKDSQPATTCSVKDQSQKLLQFLISGDERNLQGTDFKIITDVKETQMEAKRMMTTNQMQSFQTSDQFRKVTSYTDSSPLSDKTEFFTPATSTQGDFISPPVELQAFCIPTYSCKLCGREFRFEGKLHRHIESVHQNKAIFSPDVKPGRGSARDMERDYTVLEREASPSPPTTPALQKIVSRNPEIEALRSEWDDDDDGDDDENNAEYEDQKTVTEITQQQQHEVRVSSDASISSLKSQAVYIRPIITKEIVPVTDTVTDVYVSGVKVNINKISGLAGSDMEVVTRKRHEDTYHQHQPVIRPEVKMTNFLEAKCRKLLEKLFDHTLLIECGLFEEHISVVLGRLLQHYGVKMIEDYGQGQYEVLKYNLWRLIEWKVTMEQMEEFYRDKKSVEEMMDDIMNGRVPIIAHHEPQPESVVEQQPPETQPQAQSEEQPIQAVETVQLSDSQLMLSQVTNVLNLGDSVTQVVLAQDVSPEMLQGAHIVTIDPATGQVLSQVTADQVILADSLGDDLNQQIQSMDNHVVVSQANPAPTVVVSALPPGSIVAAPPGAPQIVTSSMQSEQQIVNAPGTIIKMETAPHSSAL